MDHEMAKGVELFLDLLFSWCRQNDSHLVFGRGGAGVNHLRDGTKWKKSNRGTPEKESDFMHFRDRSLCMTGGSGVK